MAVGRFQEGTGAVKPDCAGGSARFCGGPVPPKQALTETERYAVADDVVEQLKDAGDSSRNPATGHVVGADAKPGRLTRPTKSERGSA